MAICYARREPRHRRMGAPCRKGSYGLLLAMIIIAATVSVSSPVPVAGEPCNSGNDGLSGSQTCKYLEGQHLGGEENGESGAVSPVAVRAVFPQKNPDVCLSFISSVKRSLAVLWTTYQSVVTYMERDTMVTRYEMVWFDNGSPATEIERFLQRGPQLEAQQHSPENLGFAYAINQVYFGTLCSVRYVLNFEDDWRPHPTPPPGPSGSPQGGRGAWQVDHVKVALDILKQDVRVSGVRLKTEFTDLPPYAFSEEAFTVQGYQGSHSSHAKVPPTFEYKLQCLNVALTNAIWGAFTSAAAVYDRERLWKAAGELYGVPGDGFPGGGFFLSEANYATRVGVSGLCTAHVHFQEACGTAALERGDADGTFVCHNIIEHTGQLSDFVPETGRQQDLDIVWFFYGTPVFDEVQSMLRTKHVENK
eukprot:jgi/Mesvir1/16822/Mv15181-RA.1